MHVCTSDPRRATRSTSGRCGSATTGTGESFSSIRGLKGEFLDDPWAYLWNGADLANQVVATMIVATFILAIPFAGRRLGWGYAVLILGEVVTVWAFAMWFAPAGRYLLPAWPVVAAIAGEWLLDRPSARRASLAVFGAGFIVLLVCFSRPLFLNW